MYAFLHTLVSVVSSSGTTAFTVHTHMSINEMIMTCQKCQKNAVLYTTFIDIFAIGSRHVSLHFFLQREPQTPVVASLAEQPVVKSSLCN